MRLNTSLGREKNIIRAANTTLGRWCFIRTTTSLALYPLTDLLSRCWETSERDHSGWVDGCYTLQCYDSLVGRAAEAVYREPHPFPRGWRCARLPRSSFLRGAARCPRPRPHRIELGLPNPGLFVIIFPLKVPYIVRELDFDGR